MSFHFIQDVAALLVFFVYAEAVKMLFVQSRERTCVLISDWQEKSQKLNPPASGT